MKKAALIFCLAVFLPSLGLGWLACQSWQSQKIVLERQQTLIFQNACSAAARDLTDLIAARQHEFARWIDGLLANELPQALARGFDETATQSWPLAEIGFAVTVDGHILSPSLLARPQAREFRIENDQFLSNHESVEIFWPKTKFSSDPDASKEGTKGKSSAASKEPQPAEAEFRRLVGDSSEGTLARFLQNRLKFWFWHKPTAAPQYIFGIQLQLPKLAADFEQALRVAPILAPDVGLALLDEAGRPVAFSKPPFKANWAQPMISVPVGEALPHWEVAAFPLNPDRISRAARSLNLTLGLLTGLFLLAIAAGGTLVVLDIRRQVTLARKKTDFVSNVSHELKTPLTSIRMFSELLAEGRIHDPAKQAAYFKIITSEVARLSRLINNVLDFARLERGEKKYQFEKLDLVSLARETVERHRPQLEAGGFRILIQAPRHPCWIRGDPDALAQILLNLLSNAEKYSGEGREIQVEVSAPCGSKCELRVLDRGIGVPRGQEEMIFEQFYRAHDSLSSGIPGSGLGLTLARRLARAHGGDIRCGPRDGGGTVFIVELLAAIEPLTASA